MLELYKNIKKLRQERGWSQSELAKRVGYAEKSMIARVESGQVNISQTKIVAFADALGVTPGELMGSTESFTESIKAQQGSDVDMQLVGANDFILLSKIHKLTPTNYNLLVSMIETMLESQTQ